MAIKDKKTGTVLLRDSLSTLVRQGCCQTFVLATFVARACIWTKRQR